MSLYRDRPRKRKKQTLVHYGPSGGSRWGTGTCDPICGAPDGDATVASHDGMRAAYPDVTCPVCRAMMEAVFVETRGEG